MSSILSIDTRQIHRTLTSARTASEKYTEDENFMDNYRATPEGKRASLAYRLRALGSPFYFLGCFVFLLGLMAGILHLTGLASGLRGDALMNTIPWFMHAPILTTLGGAVLTGLAVAIFRGRNNYHYALNTPNRERRELEAKVKKTTAELLESVKGDLTRNNYTVSAVYPENFTFVTQHGVITFLEDHGEPTLALNGGTLPNSYADMLRPTMQTMGGQDVKVDEPSK